MVLLPEIPPERVVVRLDRIQTLVDQLSKARGDIAEQQDLAERIRREIDVIRSILQPSSDP